MHLVFVESLFSELKVARKKFRKTISGLSDDALTNVEDAREDLSFSLAELEDFALENRSIYFNSLDRKQMDDVIAESGFKENTAEGKKLLVAAQKSASTFRQIMESL